MEREGNEQGAPRGQCPAEFAESSQVDESGRDANASLESGEILMA